MGDQVQPSDEDRTNLPSLWFVVQIGNTNFRSELPSLGHRYLELTYELVMRGENEIAREVISLAQERGLVEPLAD